MPSVVRRFVDAAPAPPGTSVREDTISVGLGAWMVVGLYVDGWAHNTVRGLETFFTPWHGLLYSGFATGAAWIGLLAWRRRAGRTWWSALPPGYHAAAVGVALFGLGGLGDMAWHIAFGVEVGLDALLSPTHLVLLTGATLMLTAALRASWSRPLSPGRCSLRLDLPAILSLMLVTALAGFFLMYTSVFLRPAAAQPFVQLPEGSAGHGSDEGGAAAGLADYLVTTALLVLPVLLAARHGRRPIGTIVILVAGVAWATIAVGDFTDYGVAAALAVTAAAGAAEGAAILIDRSDLGRSARSAAVGAMVPALLWPAQLLAVAVTTGLRWPVELWSGVVVLTALAGAALGVLAESGASRSDIPFSSR